MTQQEQSRGKQVIWLLEEPESYLHPELSRSALRLLDRLRDHSILLLTTHALAFVPQDPKMVAGTVLEDHRTHVVTLPTYVEATQRLRLALGVRFSDYYNLGEYNLLLEGQSDRRMVEWLLGVIPEATRPWVTLRQAHRLDFGGVRHLSGFLRATYALIKDERSCVSVFDGDPAGEKERRDLQAYFGQRGITFQPNLQYLSVRARFAIEGLFPDPWIIDLHDEHPGWFEDFSVDTVGDLEPFRIKDNQKSHVADLLMARAEAEPDDTWAKRWLAFGDAADDALVKVRPAP